MQCAFATEQLTQDTWAELRPLLLAHWREVAHFQDIQLEPDESFYASIQGAGMARFYTARDEQGKLVGYALFIVKSNPHYASSVQAVNDVVFLDVTMRGFVGWRFLKYCDAMLEAEHVDAIYWHVKAFADFGPILERMGCGLVDQIYARRVHRGSDSSDTGDVGRLDDRAEPSEPEAEEPVAQGVRHSEPSGDGS